MELERRCQDTSREIQIAEQKTRNISFLRSKTTLRVQSRASEILQDQIIEEIKGNGTQKDRRSLGIGEEGE